MNVPGMMKRGLGPVSNNICAASVASRQGEFIMVRVTANQEIQ